MHVTLHLTHQCNLGCSYCYGGRKFTRSMSEEVMGRGVEMAFLGQSAKVSFFGGEPLLEFDLIKKAVAYTEKIEADKNGKIPTSFSITVNGTLLDDEKIAFMAEHSIRLVVSIDGCQEAHEATRPYKNGGSSYALVARNLKRAMERIPRVEILAVVDPSNVAHLPRSFDALWDLGVRCFHFNPNYTGPWNEESLAALEQGIDELANRYVRHFRDGNGFSLDLIDSKIISHLKGGLSCRDRCKFGDGEIAVAPSGRLYPCERIIGEDDDPDVSIGDVWSGVELEKVIALKKRTNEPDEECKDCAVNDRCTYWCGCVNYATTGDVGKTSGIVCRVEQARIKAADGAAEPLFAEKNPQFIRKFYSAV